VLIAPDTSPRGAGIPGEDADWDFGTGAGFYLDATQDPWSRHYRMASYVNAELPALVEAALPVLPGARGITGHSMGGHGAIVSALRNPGQWRSLSALAPIANPVAVPWGEKAFSNYLGQTARRGRSGMPPS
jgi:S-formylglutathione hydrolase